MNAEIISVGTELLLGHTVNTDTTIVARELSKLGINMLYSGTVGDNPGRLKEVLDLALSRSDLVITTGGLGPTGDDLTKETIAQAVGKKLVMHEESMKRLEEYFVGREFGESQKKQALLPEGCRVFRNDEGTAPGCAVETEDGKILIMLPGPPYELKPMLCNYAVPYLAERENAVIFSMNIRVFGMGEGAAAERIDDLTEGENPTVATYAGSGEMFVRVTAKAGTTEEAEKMCRPLVEEIQRRLGDVVYGIDVDSLEEVVVRGLTQRGMTVSTAESCTGGLLSKRITDIPGSSGVFEMGAVTYSNRIKELLLEVPEELLKNYGAVSEQVAKAMAEGVRKKSGSDLGEGITGIAGPDGGTPEKPVGLVYIALSDGNQTQVRKMTGGGKIRSREYLRNSAASNALDMIRRNLQNLPPLQVRSYCCPVHGKD